MCLVLISQLCERALIGIFSITSCKHRSFNRYYANLTIFLNVTSTIQKFFHANYSIFIHVVLNYFHLLVQSYKSPDPEVWRFLELGQVHLEYRWHPQKVRVHKRWFGFRIGRRTEPTDTLDIHTLTCVADRRLQRMCSLHPGLSAIRLPRQRDRSGDAS